MLQLVLFHFSVAGHICFFHFNAGFGLVEELWVWEQGTWLCFFAGHFKGLQPGTNTETFKDLPPSFKEWWASIELMGTSQTF